MTVRRKVFVILVVSIGLLLLATAGVARIILSRNANAQDLGRVRDNAVRLKAVLANEISILDRQVADSASSDDTYAFVRKPSRAYVESNIVLSTFANNRICFMVFLDTGGRIVQESAYDVESESPIALPAGLKDHLRPGAHLLEHPDLQTGVTGVVVLPDGFYLVASRPILTSNFQGPAAGTLVFGRRLDESLIRTFGSLLLLSLKAKPAAGREVEEDFAAGGPEGIYVRVLDSRMIEGDALIEDIDGRPALALSYVQERVFRAQFLRAWRLLLGGLLAFGTVILFSVLTLIDRRVTGRLLRLHRFVQEVDPEGDLDRRIDVGGDDEIQQLGEAANALLASLQGHVERKRQADIVSAALYEISQAASSATGLDELYGLLGKTLTALLPSPNFYVALIDEAAGWISFPLFVDEYDAPPEGRPLGRGMTEYVYRTGKPLLSTAENTLALHQAGELDLIGQMAVDWLGVPLKTEGVKIGVLAVQSYRPEARLGEEERNLLVFLSSQVAMAIERVRARERLQASLREKEALLREIHHRVKNNMQIISSLFNLQAGVITDPAALEGIRECQSRIRSMSLVHEKLYQSGNLAQIQFADYIQSLAVHLFHFWRIGADRIRLETDLDPVVLDINTAIPAGLIINEMISNALEHAFPDGRRGTIRVELHSPSAEIHEISVRDDGAGLPEGFDTAAKDTLGLQLIHMLAGQLDGTVHIAHEGGTRFTVTFKEPRLRPRS
jgi:two-component sensor histidine kinase/sensor domain CHASE-containing protein